MGKMKNKIIILLSSILVVLSTCNYIEYHPYEIRLKDDYRNLTEKNIKMIHSHEVYDDDTIRFVLMGDTHRFYDQTKDFVRHINKRKDIDFVIHDGDVSDFGMKNEFFWLHDLMKKMKFPYVTVIGNHDIIGNGDELYMKMYGPLNYSFIYKDTKFLFLNTNALEFDYSTPVPDFNWLKDEVTDTLKVQYSKSVAVMHVQPGDVQFNNNIYDVFPYYLHSLKGLMFCLHGHAHRFMVNKFYDDEITYYGSDTMKNRNYLIFTIIGDKYSYERTYY